MYRLVRILFLLLLSTALHALPDNPTKKASIGDKPKAQKNQTVKTPATDKKEINTPNQKIQKTEKKETPKTAVSKTEQSKVSKTEPSTSDTSKTETAPLTGLDAKKAICATCHGPDGNGVNPIWPKIAGQGEKYLIKTLQEYKAGDKGKRFDATMYGMTQGLTDQEIIDLAEFFSKQKMTTGVSDAKYFALGEKIYRGGNKQTGVPACGPSCHGMQGEGLLLAGIPKISGQFPEYTIDTLKKFRSNARSDDQNSIMRDIAKRMTEEEIQAVSHYLAGLH